MNLTHSTELSAGQESASTRLASLLAQGRLLALMLVNELYKALLIQWSYKFNLLMESIMLIFLFLGITFFVGNGELAPGRLPPTLVGFIVTFYAMLAISTMAYGLREEAQQGTLEQWYMSVAPTSAIQLGRTLAAFILATLTLLPVALPLMWVFQIEIGWRWAALPVFVVMLAGVYGFGFLIGGATLVFKQVGPLANMVQNLLLFLNGSFLPVDRFPGWLESFARTLPTTQGIILLRRMMLEGHSLGALWRDGTLLRLILHSSLYLVIGLVVFTFCEQQAKRRGLLGQY